MKRFLIAVVGLAGHLAMAQTEPKAIEPATAPVEVAAPAEAKPEETKVAEVKPIVVKPAETKPAEAKPSDKPSPYVPTVSGSVVLRYDDVTSTASDKAAHFASLWYGSELRDSDIFNYSARLGASGKISDQLTYGVRLMFRNQKTPAFSYPSFEPGFGDSQVVADQFYLSLKPIEQLTITVGKHPMMLFVAANYFWDLDVQPVGASERFELPLPALGGIKHGLTANFGQWLPLLGVRNAPGAALFAYQLTWDLQTGGDQGYALTAGLSVMHFNGYDRFLANASIGGVKSPTLVANADGTYAIRSVANLDFARANDVTLMGDNPVWIDATVKATARSLFGRPFVLNLTWIQNVNTAVRLGEVRKFEKAQAFGFTSGFTYGSVKKQLDWSVGYDYQWKGVAAFINGWTDDSMGSDLRGHVVTASFAPVTGATLSVVWRYLQDADGLGMDGKPLPDALAKANISSLRFMLGGKF